MESGKELEGFARANCAVDEMKLGHVFGGLKPARTICPADSGTMRGVNIVFGVLALDVGLQL